MPRVYVKKWTRSGEVDEVAMQSAMKEVLDKTLSIRKSAEKYGLKPITLESRLTTAQGLVTPEMIRPYPKVARDVTKKGKQPGKSRIYTDTPDKNRLEVIEKTSQLKKQEQERKQRAKEMKRALNQE